MEEGCKGQSRKAAGDGWQWIVVKQDEAQQENYCSIIDSTVVSTMTTDSLCFGRLYLCLLLI